MSDTKQVDALREENERLRQRVKELEKQIAKGCGITTPAKSPWEKSVSIWNSRAVKFTVVATDAETSTKGMDRILADQLSRDRIKPSVGNFEQVYKREPTP